MADEAASKKSLLRKIQFVEWIATQQGDLTSLQMAVALRLTSLFNSKRGYAWPTMEQLATEVQCSLRSVVAAVDRLEELGLFKVTRSRGRGHAHEYVPRFDRLPDGCAFQASAAQNMKAPAHLREKFGGISASVPVPENMQTRAENVQSHVIKYESVCTPSGLSTDLNTTAQYPLRHADARRRDVLNLDWDKPGASLKRIQRALKAGGACKEELQRWHDFAINLMGDHHTGGGISGLAYRLCDDIAGALEDGR